MKLGFRTALPFMRKWNQVPKGYEEIYQQMLSDMQQPDFVVTWNLLIAWGTNVTSDDKTRFYRPR